MKKNNLTNGLFTALLLFSSIAGAEQKYPASDFQPTVVYQDDDYIAKNGKAAPSASDSSKPSTTNTTSHKAEDSKYPAANFEPKVVYADPGYKHSQPTVSKGAGGTQGNLPSSESNQSDSSAIKEGDSTTGYLIGLVLFAVAGFFFFKRTPQTKAEASSRAYTKDSTGLTGVAKYLNRSSGTGVARYLEKQVKSAQASATTGVAKYMAKQTGSAKTAATAEAKTGVEKYMRKRG